MPNKPLDHHSIYNQLNFMRELTTLNLFPNQGDVLKKWYIAYTFPKAERKIYKKLEIMGIESFLPLHKVIRQWSDRKKMLEVPLFPNYIFIHASGPERFEALQIKEIVKYVSCEGKPVTVPETLITSLDKMIKGNIEVSSEEYCVGTHVKVTDGPLCGAEGVLIRKNSKTRLVIQIKALGRCVSVDISSSSVIQNNDYSGNNDNISPGRNNLVYTSIAG
jgi:transcription antitermination factor NusG